MHADVEAVKIESDERGFELHLSVLAYGEQDFEGELVLNVQSVAEELFDAVKSSIGPWLQERDNAYQEWRVARAAGELDGDSYALDDPKHPTFHERYADAADHARKVAKGE